MSDFPIIPVTVVVVGLALTPIITHILAERRARREEEARRRDLIREEELFRFRQVVEAQWSERKEVREGISAANRANEEHWWAFSALCRDWKEKRDPLSENARNHREEFHRSRRDLMVAIGHLEVLLGRIADLRKVAGRTAVRMPIYQSFQDRFPDLGKRFARIGELRTFSESLTEFIQPFIEPSSREPFDEAGYLNLREQQKDITDDYLAGSVVLQVFYYDQINNVRDSDLKDDVEETKAGFVATP